MKIRYLLLFMILTVIAAACSIKEDLSDCPPSDRYIRVHYTTGNSNTSSLTVEQLTNLNLYIFDSDNKFLQVEDIVEIGDNGYYTDVELSQGSYTFIVWTNVTDCFQILPEYLIPGATTIEELLVEIEKEEEDILRNITEPLYYGYYDSAEVSENEDHDFYIDIANQLYTINLWVRGLESYLNNFRFEITDIHGRIGYDNTVRSEELVYYVNYCSRDTEGQLSGSLNILHLQEHRQTAYLNLINSDSEEIFFSANLVELILSLKEYGVIVDFNTIFVYDIILVFGPNMEVTIYVNGWKVREDSGEISV
ncbi:MAG: FimB/Mfa2 family fimbrial subunit [Rikenellaceae bacterium]|nr:FimB/Mfa2 family fimbrial subunit [Rikenellaceae bacterium]